MAGGRHPHPSQPIATYPIPARIQPMRPAVPIAHRSSIDRSLTYTSAHLAEMHQQQAASPNCQNQPEDLLAASHAPDQQLQAASPSAASPHPATDGSPKVGAPAPPPFPLCAQNALSKKQACPEGAATGPAMPLIMVRQRCCRKWSGESRQASWRLPPILPLSRAVPPRRAGGDAHL
jgi:hypothetical protein